MEGRISGIRFCKVVSIIDDTDADRIKVRLSPEDNYKTVDDIDYAFPLLPKFFHVKPKEGEAVLVLLTTNNNGNSQRYYIGPVISQDHKIYKDPFFMGADSYLRGAFKPFDVAPRMDPEKDGILPNDEDIVIRGRKNADIQITDDDIRIKAGVKVVANGSETKMAFNIKNPSYHKLKYHNNPLIGDTYSTSTIVADKINLLSNNSPNYFVTTDRKDLITDEELNKVIESAYKLPYGEKLVEFLKVFVDAFLKHTHDFPMMSPNPFYTSSLLAQKANLLDRGELLSDTVRIN
jgi:hypothetical protein